MVQIPRNNKTPALIAVGKLLGGHLRYSSSEGGAFIRVGEPPYHVDIRKGDSVVKKGAKAIVTNGYIKQKMKYVRRYPELKPLVDDLEKLLKTTIKIEKGTHGGTSVRE